jgi:hypothetical protein
MQATLGVGAVDTGVVQGVRDSTIQRSPAQLAGERIYSQMEGFLQITADQIINRVIQAAVYSEDVNAHALRNGGLPNRNAFIATAVEYVLTEKYNKLALTQVEVPNSVDLQGLVASAYTAKDQAKACCVVL